MLPKEDSAAPYFRKFEFFGDKVQTTLAQRNAYIRSSPLSVWIRSETDRVERSGILRAAGSEAALVNTIIIVGGMTSSAIVIGLVHDAMELSNEEENVFRFIKTRRKE